MVQFRPQGREVIAKVVYYGPPLGGKTTNLRSLYNGYPDDTRGELVVVPAGGDRTIFFDFLSVEAGNLRGMKLRVQLYTVPGQVHYNATRQVVLRGVDAVVFVADSQREMVRSNRESWENLKDNLLLQGLSLQDMPHVLQYNKRDLPDVLSVEDLDALLNQYNAPFYEAVASTGIGIEETLQGVVKLLVRSLRDRFKLGAEHAREDVSHAPAVATPATPPVVVQPHTGPGGARIFPFGHLAPPPPLVIAEPVPTAAPIPAAEAAAPVESIPAEVPRARPAGPAFAENEEPDVTRKVRVPPFGEGSLAPQGYGNPFVCAAPVEGGADDDVFGAVSPSATAAGDSLAAGESAECSGPAAGSDAGELRPGAAGFGAPVPFSGVPVPLVGDEPYEVVGEVSGNGLTAEVSGVSAEMFVAPAEVEPPEGAPPGSGESEPVQRLPLEPARAFEAGIAPLSGAISDSEWIGPSVAVPVGGEAAPSLFETAVEQPFGEIHAGETPSTAEQLFIGAGFAESAAAGGASFGEAAIDELGSAAGSDASANEFEATAAGPEAGGAGRGAAAASEVTPAEAESEGTASGFEATAVGPEVIASGSEAVAAALKIAPAGTAEEGGEKPAVVEVYPSAIRRVAPRALAQLGEVRELEVEVPVPAPWTGGKRMTLQLRLTLVPQEEEHGE